jgi:peptidoglycan/LPS O-acetylase OafA/YrhL
MTAVESPTRAGTARFPCFDGFRAIAAMGVLVNHVGFFSGKNERSDAFGPFLARADIGVAVFFLISGFLLYRSFVDRIFAGAARPQVGPYLKRRALRIFPAYWVCLTVVLLLFEFHPGDDFGGLLLHYGLFQIYSPDHIIGGPVQQAWTLSVEISFYLFLPLYAWLTARFTRNPNKALRVQLIGAAILYLISLLWRGAVYASGIGDTGVYRSWLPGYFDYFALGIVLAVVSAWIARSGRREWSFTSSRAFPWVCWAIAFALFVVVSKSIGLSRGPVEITEGENGLAIISDLPADKEFGLQFLYSTSAFFFLLPGVFGPQDRGIIRGFLRNGVIVWLGLVSYGIYLWHEAAIDGYADLTDTLPFAGNFSSMLLATIVASLAIAALSYYAIERPALKLKDRSLWPTRSGKPTTKSTS